MTTVVVDNGLRDQLTLGQSPVEICDETGRRIGLFIPSTESDRELWEWARGAFSDEELDRAAQEPGGCTLDEILAKLQAQ